MKKNKNCIIAIDQGTTGSRVYIFNAEGDILANEYKELSQHFPKPAWVEHDPEEIWSSVVMLLRKALKKSSCKAKDILGVGITNQRETALAWECKTAKPIYNAIVWQCRRTAKRCEELKKENYTKLIHKKTGLLIDAYFSATKIEWILDNVSNARTLANAGDIAVGTIDSWLLFKMTGEHATDYTNASRTLLYDIERKDWDSELLKLFRVPQSVLPNVYPSRHSFGNIISIPELEGVPVLGMIGDQQSALFGQLCVEPGYAKNTYGTGSFLLMHTGNERLISKSSIMATLACNADGQVAYALEGAAFIAGAAMQWLRDSLKFFPKVKDSETLAQKIENERDEVVFVPAFSGLGAPHWDMQARGAILGLSRDTSIAQITRAALKSIALQTYDIVQAMEEESKQKLNVLRVDGGASANDFLMKYQSGILDRPVERPVNLEATALGAAYLAGMEAGLWTISDLKKMQGKKKRFENKMDESERQRELKYWHKGIERTKQWSE